MAKHSLMRLTSKLHNTPHLISQSGLDVVMQYLHNRNAGLLVFDDNLDDPNGVPTDIDDFSYGQSVGVINVIGPLSYYKVDAMCGNGVSSPSYTNILEQVEEQIDCGVKIIILNIDSPGGEAYACFETANQMRAMCDANEVKLYAYVDGCCASAAMALAIVCDEVVANPAAEVGSIGVCVSLVDSSKAMDMQGYKPIYITAGKNKVPYDADGSFTKSFLDNIQAKVDVLYDQFAQHISDYSQMSVQDVKNTDADMFNVVTAEKLGLITSSMTHVDFIDHIVAQLPQGTYQNV